VLQIRLMDPLNGKQYGTLQHSIEVEQIALSQVIYWHVVSLVFLSCIWFSYGVWRFSDGRSQQAANGSRRQKSRLVHHTCPGRAGAQPSLFRATRHARSHAHQRSFAICSAMYGWIFMPQVCHPRNFTSSTSWLMRYGGATATIRCRL
jgi:hypothetical protein